MEPYTMPEEVRRRCLKSLHDLRDEWGQIPPEEAAELHRIYLRELLADQGTEPEEAQRLRALMDAVGIMESDPTARAAQKAYMDALQIVANEGR